MNRASITPDILFELEQRLGALKARGVIDLVPDVTVNDLEKIFEQDFRSTLYRPGPRRGPGLSRHGEQVTVSQARHIDSVLSNAERNAKPGGRCRQCGEWSTRLGPNGWARCEDHDHTPSAELNRAISESLS